MSGLPCVTEPGCAPGQESPLNARDLELLRLLADGTSTAQAAVAMSVTTNTVRTRVRRIQRKLGVAARAEAVRLARQTGLV